MVLGLLVLLFSGCRVYSGDYKISGRVTSADPNEGITGVTINCETNYMKKKVYTYGRDGRWEIGANHGERVTIWAQKDSYIFQPASPYKFTVTENKNDVNFQAIGWYDDFSNRVSGWSSDAFSNYEAGKYWIRVTSDYTSVKTIAPLSVPLSYSIKAEMSQGLGSGGYGFVFNLLDLEKLRVDDFYHILRVTPEATYKNYEIIKAKVEGIYPEGAVLSIEEITSGFSPLIESNINTLEIKQVWKEVFIYINNNLEPLWSGEIEVQQNADFLKVGLYACINSGDSYTAWFDNFTLTAIGFRTRTVLEVRSLDFQESMTHKDIELTK